MKQSKSMAALGLLAILAGCAGTPAPTYYTLDQGAPDFQGQRPKGLMPSIVITQISLPDLIDRPQLVIRTADNQVRVSELQRWAEPLRRQIPRVLADDLGVLLGSSRVASVPFDGQGFNADFRLLLDIQHLEAKAGEGATVDVIWRLEPRKGQSVFGRSQVREAVVGNDPAGLVAAQRRALAAVAAEIAAGVPAIPESK